MISYINHFLYVVEHKWNVFIESLKEGYFLHAITHDLSKFLPSEFFAYANKFQGNPFIRSDRIEDDFDIAWLKHQRRNKHHWNYWVNSEGIPVPMPKKYIIQMIIDWRAMSRKFGDTDVDFYEKNKMMMKLHKETKFTLELFLYRNKI